MQGGPFLWLTRPGTRLLRHDGIDGGDISAVEAFHDGYAAEGAVHRRTLVLDRRSRILDVIDTVEAASGTLVPIRLAFNLHPDVACDLRAGRAELSWRGKEGGRQRAVLTLPQSLHWTVHRGETNPVLGWYSESFGNKEPAPLLLGIGNVAPNQPFSSRLAFGPAGPAVALASGEALANAGAAR